MAEEKVGEKRQGLMLKKMNRTSNNFGFLWAPLHSKMEYYYLSHFFRVDLLFLCYQFKISVRED